MGYGLSKIRTEDGDELVFFGNCLCMEVFREMMLNFLKRLNLLGTRDWDPRKLSAPTVN